MTKNLIILLAKTGEELYIKEAREKQIPMLSIYWRLINDRISISGNHHDTVLEHV